MNGDDRDRGVLTDADRAYLRGERTYASEQSERNARARIRTRLFEGVRDFELLVESLSDHDRELVFEKRFGELDGAEAFDSLVAWLACCYLAVDDTGLDFESVLHEAVNVAEAGDGRAASVDLEVTYGTLSADGLLRKLELGRELSLTELAFLHRSDDVGRDQLARYFSDGDRERIDDGRIQSKVTEF